MRLKRDFHDYLHDLRTREFAMIFSHLPRSAFERALEIGGGDGFQSGLLKPYCESLICTDLERPPRADSSDGSLLYLACDARDVDLRFSSGEFDLVFSSNVLEHIEDTQRVLKAVHRVLADDGISIHVMPNALWKASSLALYHPDLIARRLERIGRKEPGPAGLSAETPCRVRPLWKIALSPEPHGTCARNRDEFAAFSRSRWRREFAAAGFHVVAELKGPFFSGYGFGFDRLRRLCERMGMTVEFAYILKKTGYESPYEEFFSRPK